MSKQYVETKPRFIKGKINIRDLANRVSKLIHDVEKLGRINARFQKQIDAEVVSTTEILARLAELERIVLPKQPNPRASIWARVKGWFN